MRNPLAPYSIKSSIAHILTGFLAGFFLSTSHLFSLIVTFLFLYYEHVEEEKIHDEEFYEIREYTAGFISGFLLSLLLG